MDPTREPQSTAAEPTAPRDLGSDAAVVAYLRDRAPGMPDAPFDPRAVTFRARGALQRLRRRRLGSAVAAVAATVTVYLVLALAGPVLPVVGPVNVPGGHAIRVMVEGLVPGQPPAPDQWRADVDELERYVLPVVDRLDVTYYRLESGTPCRILEYSRGHYADPAACADLVQFDEQARVDFDQLTVAVERAGVTVERITYDPDGFKFQLPDSSWQYNYEYVYRPYVDTPPAIRWPGEEEWTNVRGHWWFHRTHDD